MEQFTNIRFQSKSFNKMKNEIKHELRMVKVQSVKNDNSNYIYINDNNKGNFKSQQKNMQNVGNKFFKKLEDIEELHRKLLRKNQNQSLNKNRHNSFNSGVLTFSDSIKELVKKDKQKVIDLGIKTIKNICKELDIELHYITLHLDEAGLPHFHYFTNNFNSKGQSVSTKRNKKLGEKLQDLGNIYFKELGFKRGISKSKSGRVHLTIKEYQDYQDTQKELENKKEEVKHLEERNKNLIEENHKLDNNLIENKSKIDLLIEQNKYLQEQQEEYINSLKDTLNTFVELGLTYKGKDINGLWKLFDRYLGKNQIDKLTTLQDKLNTLITRAEKTNKTKPKPMNR